MEEKFTTGQFVLGQNAGQIDWTIDIFGCYDPRTNKPLCLGGRVYEKLLPYEGNEHLISKPEAAPEVRYTPEDGEFIAFGRDENGIAIGIFKKDTSCGRTREHEDYCDIDYDKLCLPPKSEDQINWCEGWTYDGMRPATEAEKQRLLDALHEAGKDWDAEAKRLIEYKRPLKEGDKVFWVSYNCTKDRFDLYDGLVENPYDWKSCPYWTNREVAERICRERNEFITKQMEEK